MTTIILDPSHEKMRGGKLPARAAMSMRREPRLCAVPGRLLHDRGMLAIVGLHIPARRDTRRQDPEGCQARRSPDRATDQVRAGHQPQDRQGTRLEDPPHAPRPCRRGDRMRRREFFIIGGMVTGGAAGWPLASRAQQAGKVARIGFLGSATAAGSAKSVDALRTGLRDLGYMEGKNIVVEFQWAEGNYERLPALVAELIHRNVDIIITHGTPGTRAAKQATTTILIVMAISGDALATGLVASLARPEANLTGSTLDSTLRLPLFRGNAEPNLD